MAIKMQYGESAEAARLGGGGIKLTSLWTNSAPTSSFAAQTVSLDLAQYKLILITFHNFATSDAQYGLLAQLCIVGEKNYLQFTSATNNRSGRRLATVSSTGVDFAACVYNNGTNNSYGIPYQIYGIQ